MANSQQVKDQIREYILREFLRGESASNLTDTLDLKESRIFDSMSTLKLVSFIEETFQITVDASDASNRFRTIQDMADLVEEKQ
ncbi:MAG: acyl carrier protein [Pirellulaceae bacterium]